MAAPDAEKALNAITTWSRRLEWRERFATVVESHLALVTEHFDFDPQSLADVLGPDLHALLGICMFEDFLSATFNPDGANVIQDYLSCPGLKEPVPDRHYLEALRDSVMSYWEVVDTTPGSHFAARDLLRGGDPVRIDDTHGAGALQRGDRIAARMLPVGDKTVMSPGMLPMPCADADEPGADVNRIVGELRESLMEDLESEGVAVDRVDDLPLDEAALHEAPEVFTRIWLASVLDARFGHEMPATRDGEGPVVCQARLPIVDAAREVAAGRLPPYDSAWMWEELGLTDLKD